MTKEQAAAVEVVAEGFRLYLRFLLDTSVEDDPTRTLEWTEFNAWRAKVEADDRYIRTEACQIVANVCKAARDVYVNTDTF